MPKRLVIEGTAMSICDEIPRKNPALHLPGKGKAQGRMASR